MFRFMDRSEGNVVAVEATGRLTHADYKDVLLPKLDALFEQYGKINLLCYLGPEFEGWDLHGSLDDTVFGLRHRADFGKLAIVGGPAWFDALIRFGGFLMKGEIRTFGVDELDAAWDWTREAK